MSEDFWVLLIALGLVIACFYNALESYSIMHGYMQ